eukprot:gb/GECH01012083.1/.p1 GENE.gb/GECH01012083.1/~~gb/GECH01012083.1/.p1  ORF type:complete len:367 (+),score=69.26 gb/GECH01012083.1/:1-1101(+)
MASVTPLVSSITAHSWNAERNRVAICPNSEQIIIYKAENPNDPSQWEQEHVLEGHDQVVSCISWAPKSNQILSCSYDRNAYVWNYSKSDRKWKPSLVILRNKKAATCCSWNCDETKFAVGSSSKCVSVCHFDSKENWWVGKETKTGIFNSTVTSVEWHPHQPSVYAAVSTDGKCRVISGYIKHVDDPSTKKESFGKILAEFDLHSWGLDVSWSPSANLVVAVSYNSCVTIFSMENHSTTLVRLRDLPAKCIGFLSDNIILTAGFDRCVTAVVRHQNDWRSQGIIEQEGLVLHERKKGSVGSLLAQFENVTQEEEVRGLHKNSIVSLHIFGDKKSWSTAGLDGRVIMWQANKIKKPEGLQSKMQMKS